MSEVTVVCYDSQGNPYLMLQKVYPDFHRQDLVENTSPSTPPQRGVIVIDMFDEDDQECYEF